MRVTTPPCMVCGKTSEMVVDSTAFFRWHDQGWLIQAAFPDMPAPEREQLKTGTHPACWDEMFADEEDENPIKEADPRYVPGISENDDDMTNAEWVEAMGPVPDEYLTDFADPDPMSDINEHDNRL